MRRINKIIYTTALTLIFINTIFMSFVFVEKNNEEE